MSDRSRERRKRGKPESCVTLEYVQDETSKPNPPEPSGGNGKAVAYGMIAGIMTAIIFRFIMDDNALAITIGTGVGIALGAGLTATKRPK